MQLNRLMRNTINKFKLDPDSMGYQILSITLPAFVELVMSTLFGMVDLIMVGKLNPASITAVGLTNQPFMLLLAVFAAVNVGTTTLIAWSIGSKDIEKAHSITRQVLVINLTLGIIMSVVGLLSSRTIVTFMGAKPDTIEDAVAYFRIVSAGLVFQTITLGITASLRGAGETKIPMFYNIFSNLLNVFGNYVLIYGKFGLPQWGVAGAAVSTSLSRLVACMCGLYVIYCTDHSVIKVSLKQDYRPDFSIIRKIFRIGLPAAGEQFILQSGLVLYARTVSSLGTLAYAAHQIGLNISGLSFSPSMAFGIAATTLVGQSLGAKNEEKAEEYANTVHHIAIVVACFVGLLFLAFSHPLARLYTSDTAVAGMAGVVLKIIALAQPGQSTQMALAGALRGAGDTMYPLYASLFGIWGFRVLCAYIFVSIFKWGLIGAWVALVLDQYMRSIIIFLRFRSGKWKHIKSRK